MEIKINLEHDSDNTDPHMAEIAAVGSDIQISLVGPYRVVRIDAEDLLKILNILF